MRTVLFTFGLFCAFAFMAFRFDVGAVVANGFGIATAPAAEDSMTALEDDESSASTGQDNSRQRRAATRPASGGEGGASAHLDSFAVQLPELLAAPVMRPSDPAEPSTASGLPYPGRVVELMMTASVPPQSLPPELQNKDELADLVRKNYPDGTRRAGRGGTVVLTLHIDAMGSVHDVAIRDRLAFDELNVAAEKVAKAMRFSPARQLGRNVESAVEFTLTFQP